MSTIATTETMDGEAIAAGSKKLEGRAHGA